MLSKAIATLTLKKWLHFLEFSAYSLGHASAALPMTIPAFDREGRQGGRARL